MRRINCGGLRPALLALLALAAILSPATPAGAATRKPVCSAARQAYPLHGGSKGHPASCGQRVSDLQWLLAGHKPSVYSKTRPTFKGKPNGLDGARTKAAVRAMKYRIGYPAKGQCPTGRKTTAVTETAGAEFVRILEGKEPRPICWVHVASLRIKGVVVPGATVAALRIKQLELSQLGVHEDPAGSNRGPRISYAAGGFGPYQGSTGAFGEAWCASFGDWALIRIIGHGFGTANDAFVPTIAEYAQAHGWLQAKPRVGSYVVFLNHAGQLGSAYHIGYVISLVGSSGVMTIEGNSGTAYGGAVREVYRRFSVYDMVYVDVPDVA